MPTRTVAREVNVTVDGGRASVAGDMTVAAALLNRGVWSLRESVSGAARGPLCGMGVCFECRVTIDGVPHRRACLTPVREGMVVTTGVAGP